MDLVRIGEKVVSKKKIDKVIKEILELRQAGYSQNEVAQRLSIDRTFISRLETLGEVRKGKRIAVIGFPISNKKELEETLASLGVDFSLLMTEEERWQFVKEKSGLELFNSIMDIVAGLHGYDHVVVIGSNKRIRIVEAVMVKDVIGYEIGESPIQENKHVNLFEIKELIKNIQA